MTCSPSGCAIASVTLLLGAAPARSLCTQWLFAVPPGSVVIVQHLRKAVQAACGILYLDLGSRSESLRLGNQPGQEVAENGAPPSDTRSSHSRNEWSGVPIAVCRPDHRTPSWPSSQGVDAATSGSNTAPALVLTSSADDGMAPDGVRAVDHVVGRKSGWGCGCRAKRHRRDAGVAHDPFDRAARIVYRAGHAKRAAGVKSTRDRPALRIVRNSSALWVAIGGPPWLMRPVPAQ